MAQHLASPMVFGANGAAKTVEQGSPADLRTLAYNVCVCPVGFRQDLPEYGIPDLLFSRVPLSIEGVKQAVERWAGVTATVSEAEEALQAADRRIELEVS